MFLNHNPPQTGDNRMNPHGKTENRGGARPSSGPKTGITTGKLAKERILAAIDDAVAAGGKSPEQVLVKLATVGKGMARPDYRQVVIPAQRILWDVLTKGESHQEIEIDDKRGPGVALPEEAPELAPSGLTVVGGKDAS